MPKKKCRAEQFGDFDWSIYGHIIRKRRVELGYRKAEDYAIVVRLRTNLNISRDILYKIEQGKQKPDADQFLALNIALFGKLLPEEVMKKCQSREWRQVTDSYETGVRQDDWDGSGLPVDVEHPFVPKEWAEENAQWLFNLGVDIDANVGRRGLCEEHDRMIQDGTIKPDGFGYIVDSPLLYSNPISADNEIGVREDDRGAS